MLPLRSLPLAFLLVASSLIPARTARAQGEAPQRPALVCTLVGQPVIDAADAHTARDIVCAELARRTSHGHYEVAFSKLGTRLYLTVASVHSDETRDERRVPLNGIEEVEVAAPRIAESIIENKAFIATETVNSVLSHDAADQAANRTKSGRMSFLLAVLAAAAPGAEGAAPAPGVAMGLHYRIGHLGINGDLNFATGENLKFVVLDSGARYFFGDQDTAPYVGGGMGISALEVNSSTPKERGNGGVGLYAEGGLDLLRSSKVGFNAGLRLDAPLYSLKGRGGAGIAMPISLIAGIRFN